MTQAFEDALKRTRHCEIILQESLIPSTLTDFTVLLTHACFPNDMLDADAGNAAQNGGGDIRFSSDPEGVTQLACDIVTFTTDNNPALAVAEVYVKIPSLSGTLNTSIWVHYKATTTTAQPTRTHAYGQDNARDANYQLHCAMKDDPSGAAPQMIDRTVNVRHGTSGGSMTSGDVVDGQIGKCLDFDGVNDRVDFTDFLDGASALTLSYWGKRSVTTTRLLMGRPRDANNAVHYYQDSDGNCYVNVSNGSASYGSFAQNDTSWRMYTMVYDGGLSGNSNRLKAYLDSTAKTLTFSGTIPATAPNLGAWLVGHDILGGGYSTGLHDAISIHNTARSADWVTATYNNESNPGAFAVDQTAVGDIVFEDSLTRLHFCYLDVQASKVLGTQTDFSVCITKDCLPNEILDADGGFAALNGGGDVRISRGQTQLPADVIQFATNNTPANAVVDVRTKTTLTTTQNVRLTIWWGAAGATLPSAASTYGRENAYDSNWKLFYPLYEDPSGGAPQYTDRTVTHANGTSSGSMTSGDVVDGKVAKAIDFDGTDDKVDTSTKIQTLTSTAGTVLWWHYNHKAHNDSTKHSPWGQEDTDANLSFGCIHWTDNNIYVGFVASGDDDRVAIAASSSNWPQNTWASYALTWTNTGTTTLYKDASSIGTKTGTTTRSPSFNMFVAEFGNPDAWFDGLLDDFAIHNVVRDSNWLTTYYNNTNDPATFVLDQTPVLGAEGHPACRRLWGVRGARRMEIGREGVLVC